MLRHGLVALAAITTAGIVAELAIERHWTQPIQLVAWGAAVALGVGAALLLGFPSRTRVTAVRGLAVVVLLTAVLGVWQHVYSNYDSGPLDRNYSRTWDSLPETTRWWLAISKTIGPSPPFAPGALAEASLALLLATVRHPALSQESPPGEPPTNGDPAAVPNLRSRASSPQPAASDTVTR
jgi:hypothetical protein